MKTSKQIDEEVKTLKLKVIQNDWDYESAMKSEHLNQAEKKDAKKLWDKNRKKYLKELKKLEYSKVGVFGMMQQTIDNFWGSIRES